MRIRALVAVIALIVVGSCGKDEPAASKKTDLTITVTPDEGVTPTVWTLTCNPVGGDHPQVAKACEKLEAVGARVFEPIPKGQACTMIYGGPQTATVVGMYAGSPINATFNRTDGCQIARWDALGDVFFDPLTS